MSFQANKSGRMKITVNRRYCNLEPLLTLKERVDLIWNCTRCEHFIAPFDLLRK